MKTLETLIKLKKQELDKLLVQITRLEATKENLIKTLNKILKQAEEEKSKYSATEYALILEKYLKYVKEQKEIYNKRIASIDSQIQKLRENLFNLYGELKKFEIVLKNRIKAEEEARQKAEDRERDEVTTLRYKNPNN